MAWNGSGVFSRVTPVASGSTAWAATKAAGDLNITTVDHDYHDQDIAGGITNCIAKDGQNVPIHTLPMAGFRHTGVGNGVAKDDYAALNQVQSGAVIWGGTSGGSANAQTIAITPVLAAYAAGQQFSFLPGFTNTGATTLNVDSIGAATVQLDGNPLAAGQITAGRLCRVQYDGTNFQLLGTDVYLPLAGGTISGPLAVAGVITAGSNTASSAASIINGATATNRLLQYQTAGVSRWAFFADNSAESGSNAGSNLFLNAYNDAGAFLGNAFQVNRATQVLSFTKLPGWPASSTSLAVTGYQKLPNGLMLQWGHVGTINTGFTTVTFPLAFPSALLALTATTDLTGGGAAGLTANITNPTTTTFQVATYDGTAAKQGSNISWYAVGN